MNDVLFFYIPGCPYCRRADKLLDELCREHPDFAAVSLRRVDETREPVLAESYDYYRVPTLFFGRTKLYEAHPSHSEAEMKSHLQKSLERVLATQKVSI